MSVESVASREVSFGTTLIAIAVFGFEQPELVGVPGRDSARILRYVTVIGAAMEIRLPMLGASWCTSTSPWRPPFAQSASDSQAIDSPGQR